KITPSASDIRLFLSGKTLRELGPVQSKFLPGEQKDEARRAPSEPIQNVAEDYAKSAGIDYSPDRTYAPVDPELFAKIAEFYTKAKHAPDSPEVSKSYDAFIAETLAQYQKLIDSGYTMELNKQPYGQADLTD